VHIYADSTGDDSAGVFKSVLSFSAMLTVSLGASTSSSSSCSSLAHLAASASADSLCTLVAAAASSAGSCGERGVEMPIDSGIGLSIRIDNLRGGYECLR
jgi:hypothetical protein